MLHITLPIHYFITVSQSDIRTDKFTSTPFDRGECVSCPVDPQHVDRTQIFCIAGRFFTVWATRDTEAQNCCMIHPRSHKLKEPGFPGRSSPISVALHVKHHTSISHNGFCGSPIQGGQGSEVALVVKNLPANTGDVRVGGSIPG